MGLVANGGRTRVMKGLRGSKQLSNLFFKFIQHCNKVLFFFHFQLSVNMYGTSFYQNGIVSVFYVLYCMCCVVQLK